MKQVQGRGYAGGQSCQPHEAFSGSRQPARELVTQALVGEGRQSAAAVHVPRTTSQAHGHQTMSGRRAARIRYPMSSFTDFLTCFHTQMARSQGTGKHETWQPPPKLRRAPLWLCLAFGVALTTCRATHGGWSKSSGKSGALDTRPERWAWCRHRHAIVYPVAG